MFGWWVLEGIPETVEFDMNKTSSPVLPKKGKVNGLIMSAPQAEQFGLESSSQRP